MTELNTPWYVNPNLAGQMRVELTLTSVTRKDSTIKLLPLNLL